MSGMLLVGVLVCGTPATRPAVSALRARVADLERKEIDHLRTLIKLADAAGDTAAERRAYQRLDILGAATAADRLHLGLLYLKAGTLEEARAVLTGLRQADQADLRYVYLLAAAADQAGRTAERDDLLKTAARLRPIDKAAHLAAGDFLAENDLVSYAEREWARVLAIREGSPAVEDVEAHTRLAALAQKRRAHEAAVGHYRAALGLAASEGLDLPQRTADWLTVQMAMALRDAGQAAEAAKYLPLVERFYRDRLQSDPTDADACNALGWFYAGVAAKLDEGVTLLQNALAAQPNKPEYLDTLAELHFRRGEPEKAVELIDRAIAAKPGDLDYYRRQRVKFERALDRKKDAQP